MFQFSQAPSGVAYLGPSYAGSDIAGSDDEPSFDELTHIQHYEALIAAEIDAVDAECHLISALERFAAANKAVDGLRQAYAAVA